MATYFADDIDQLSFGVQASNVQEVAQFSSTLDNVVIRMFTNNGVETPDNLTTGVAIGSSNYDKTATASNNLYIGHITGKSNINPVFLMQDSKIAVNTVPFSNYSLTVNGGMSIDTISTPWLVASNVNDAFYNIAAQKYINSASVYVSEGPTPSGMVGFLTNFAGNSTSYTYRLSFTSNNVSIVSPPQTITGTNSGGYADLFNTGTYNTHIYATTPGVGTGATYIASNILSFTIGVTDDISNPSMTLSGTPTFSTSNLVTVSGIQYYGSGTVMTFPINSITFGDMYKTIDPRTINTLTPLTINNTTYQYNSVFTNVTVASSSNNFALSTTLTGTANALKQIPAGVRNVNYQSVYTAYPNFVPNVAYVGTAINEATMSVAVTSGLPIASATRLTIAGSEQNPLTPAISSMKDFTTANSAPSAFDSFYDPINKAFYSNYTSVTRGSYAPTLPGGLSTTAYYLLIRLTTTAALSSFVLTLNNTNGNQISNVRVYWASLGQWYDAKVFYTVAGGCAASTYTNGAIRFPITVPQGLTVTAATNVYINIEFNGGINAQGITVSYT